MKQTAVIGLGTFGATVARTLYEMDQEVLAIDIDQDKVDDMMEYATQAIQTNAADEDVLRSLGLRNFDVVVVTVADDLQASVLISMMCKEQGAKYVVARARNELHARLLQKVGVDKIIFPEKDTALQLARALVNNSVLDLIELSPEYSLAEITVPAAWVGQTLATVNMNHEYGLIAIAITRGGKTQIAPKANDALCAGDGLAVVGANENLHRFEKKFGAEIRPASLQ